MKIRATLLSVVLLLSLRVFAGDTASEVKKISTFTVLKVQGNFNIVLTPGDNCSLKISGNKADIDGVHATNTGVTLAITIDGSTSNLTLYITFKELQQLTVSGNIKISDTKEIKSDDLSLNVDGNTEGSLDLKVKMLTFTSNTDKNLTLKGKADKANAKVEGEGAIDMSDLKVDDLTIDYAGDTDIKVYAHPDLHVKMAGSGNLTYYGNPKVKIFKVNGTGNPIEGK